MRAFVDGLATSAPAGSEAAVGALTSVIVATNKLCETMYQTTKQAVEAAEQNFNAASSNTRRSKP